MKRMHRITFPTTFHVIIQVNHVTKSAFASIRTIFVKSIAIAHPIANNAFPVRIG